MDVKITTEGFDKLDRLLHQLPDKIAKKVLRKAVTEGCKVIEKEATRLVGKGRGYIGHSTKLKGHVCTGSIGVNKKHWYLVFQETGTKTYQIVAKKKKVLANVVEGIFFGKKVTIPKRAAKPFLRPAADSKFEAAVKRLGEVLAQGIDREAEALK